MVGHPEVIRCLSPLRIKHEGQNRGGACKARLGAFEGGKQDGLIGNFRITRDALVETPL